MFTRIASLFNEKARQWIKGRSDWKKYSRPEKEKLIWFHCASVGEFEQARPIIEALRNDHAILLSFFSPSGFQSGAAKDLADICCYLPTDTRSNARKFLDHFQPDAILFVKYEFWYNFMEVVHQRNLPFALVSAYFPEGYSLLKFPGNLMGKRLNRFSHVFVQDELSKRSLESALGLSGITVSGDTRMDRVLSNRNSVKELPKIQGFIGESDVLVVGSNWPEDDNHLIPAIQSLQNIKCIVAPHELGEGQLKTWKDTFQDELITYDDLEAGRATGRVLYVNKIGLLSSLYRFATVAYVGGGFGSAVHNTLEAAVWGCPVICGPENSRFLEIQQLKAVGVIQEIGEGSLFEGTLKALLDDPGTRSSLKSAAEEYFASKSGATTQVLNWIRSQL